MSFFLEDFIDDDIRSEWNSHKNKYMKRSSSYIPLESMVRKLFLYVVNSDSENLDLCKNSCELFSVIIRKIESKCVDLHRFGKFFKRIYFRNIAYLRFYDNNNDLILEYPFRKSNLQIVEKFAQSDNNSVFKVMNFDHNIDLTSLIECLDCLCDYSDKDNNINFQNLPTIEERKKIEEKGFDYSLLIREEVDFLNNMKSSSKLLQLLNYFNFDSCNVGGDKFESSHLIQLLCFNIAMKIKNKSPEEIQAITSSEW